jgi:hypothetical protein
MRFIINFRTLSYLISRNMFSFLKIVAGIKTGFNYPASISIIPKENKPQETIRNVPEKQK